MIYQYIKELIESNNRIIIPDFGAFMIQSSPSGKVISFNDFLKFNDGLLVNQIIKAEKVSKAQASDSIKAYISEVEKAFDQNKAFEIVGVGFLIKDDHGNIKFQDKVDDSAENTKATETKVEKEVEKVVDKKPEIAATDSTPIIELAEEKKEKPVEVKKEAVIEDKKTDTPEPVKTIKEEAKAESPTAPIVEKKEEKPQVSIPPRQTSKPIPKKPIPAKPIPAKPIETKARTTAPAQKPKVGTTKQPGNSTISNSGSNKKLIIIIAAVVLIGGLGGAYLMGWFSSKPEPVVVEAPVIIKDTVVEEPEPIEEPKVVEEPDHDPNAKKYYIVAGSFKVASNADGFQQKLMDEGFDSEIVVRNNGFHTVSYKTLYNWQEALSEWKAMRATNVETWILVR